MSKVTQLERGGTGTGHPVSQSQSPHSSLPHLIIKNTFKHTAKLKDFHREHMTIHHLDSDVNIITFYYFVLSQIYPKVVTFASI